MNYWWVVEITISHFIYFMMVKKKMAIVIIHIFIIIHLSLLPGLLDNSYFRFALLQTSICIMDTGALLFTLFWVGLGVYKDPVYIDAYYNSSDGKDKRAFVPCISLNNLKKWKKNCKRFTITVSRCRHKCSIPLMHETWDCWLITTGISRHLKALC